MHTNQTYSIHQTSSRLQPSTTWGNLGKADAWSIDDLDLAAWEGYSLVVALASYQATQPITHVSAELLKQHLANDHLFQHVTLELRIAQMSEDAWRRGSYRAIPAAPNEAAGEAPMIVASEELTEEVSSETDKGELANEWFTRSDLKRWSRTSAGKLSAQAQ